MLAVAHVIRHDLAAGALVQPGFPGTPVPARVPAAADALLRFAGSAEATEVMMAAAGPRGLVRRGTQVHVALWSSRGSRTSALEGD